METELFVKFGMTPTEEKVYSSILGLKDTPIGYIIKKQACIGGQYTIH